MPSDLSFFHAKSYFNKSLASHHFIYHIVHMSVSTNDEVQHTNLFGLVSV